MLKYGNLSLRNIIAGVEICGYLASRYVSEICEQIEVSVHLHYHW